MENKRKANLFVCFYRARNVEKVERKLLIAKSSARKLRAFTFHFVNFYMFTFANLIMSFKSPIEEDRKKVSNEMNEEKIAQKMRKWKNPSRRTSVLPFNFMVCKIAKRLK